MPSLLILPPPPTPHSRETLTAAYNPPLTATLKALCPPPSFPPPPQSSPPPTLTILLPAPFLYGRSYTLKTLLWTTTQSLLAHLYSLIVTITTMQSLTVDTRIVPVDYDGSARPFVGDKEWSFKANGTTVGDLRAFVGSWGPWERLFRVDTEAGNKVFGTVIKLLEGRFVIRQGQIITVPGGLSMSLAGKKEELTEKDGKGFGVVCIGGTFDHLHGDTAELVVGITGDEMLRNKKHAELIEPWAARAWAVVRFLSSLLDIREVRGCAEPEISVVEETGDKLVVQFREGTVRVRCVAIQDGFGPTVTEEEMDVLVVSGETREGGEAVNGRRRALGWRELEVYEVDVLEARREEEEGRKGQGFEGKISSTAIREEVARRRPKEMRDNV